MIDWITLVYVHRTIRDSKVHVHVHTVRISDRLQADIWESRTSPLKPMKKDKEKN
jgi:hypothetical protein